MMFLKIFLIIVYSLKICFAAVPITTPPTAKIISTSCNAASNSNYTLQLHTPFMDMHIEHQHNLHILQVSNGQQLFLLHGHELMQIFLTANEKRLSLIALLNGNVRSKQPLGAEIINWHGYLILAIALEERLEIYQMPLQQIKERAEIARDVKRQHETAPLYEPIQELMLHGRFQYLFLTEVQPQQLMLILAMNFTKLYGKLHTYEWLYTYFDPLEQLTVSAFQTLQLIGTQPKYLIRGRANKAKTETILNVYEIRSSPSLSLQSIQIIKVPARAVNVYTFQDVNYLIACSSLKSSTCNSYNMSNGHFSISERRSGKEFYFEQLSTNSQYMVGARQNEVRVFTDAQFSCYSGFSSNDTQITDVVLHTNELEAQYILLFYKRTFNALIRIIDVSRHEGELLAMQNKPTVEQTDDSFESIISRLRSLLLQRKMAMDVFRKINFMLPMLSGRLRTNEPLTLHAGHIAELKIIDNELHSPMQLLQRVEQMAEHLVRNRHTRNVKESVAAMKTRSVLSVKNLLVENLLYNGTILAGFSLNETNSTSMLTMANKVSSKTLQVKELIKLVNNTTVPFWNTTTVSGDLHIQSLHVQRINELNWQDFYDSIYLKNRNDTIKGRLILQNSTRIVNLWTDALNEHKVDELFNLKLPQNISSNMHISRFFVTGLKADKINELNFAEDIVFKGQNVLIETPVSMQKVSIAGDLHVADNAELNRLAQAEPSLKQYYTGKVIINGSLFVQNLQRDDPEVTKFYVNEMELNEQVLRENYLLDNEPQHFEQPVIFGNAKVTAPSLETNFLNNHPTEQHLLKSQQTITNNKPMFLVFSHAIVQGDVVCTQKSKLFELSENIVQRGQIANITGIKHFQAGLQVRHLMTLELNKQPVSDLVLRGELQQDVHFKGVKIFDKLMVEQGLSIAKALNATFLNNLPLQKLLNQDYYMKHLSLPHALKVNNIVFQTINGIAFDDLFAKFHVKKGQLVLHKDLIFEGNVQFNENLQVKHINGIDWPLYEQSLVRFNENALINGRKSFLSELTIAKELKVPTINKIKLEDLFANILSKSTAQTITGHYTFNSLELQQLEVSVINDVPTAALIDTRAEHIEIESDLIVPRLTVHGHMAGEFMHQLLLETLKERIEQLLKQPWQNLLVLGNAYWNASTDNTQLATHLNFLYKNAVQRQADQTISGNVQLISPIITDMRSSSNFKQFFNIDFIAQDCLLKQTKNREQVVSAANQFLQPLKLANFETKALLHSAFVNDIDIMRFNASLYRLSSSAVIVGPLHFKIAPNIIKLHVQGLLNERRIDQIYQQSNTAMPAVQISNLTIDNTLMIQNVNGVNFNDFLAKRITKHDETLEIHGHLTFENLILNKDIMLQSINDIAIDNLVFKHSKQLQAITGDKYIGDTLILQGPAHVMRLNGNDVVETYQQTVFKNRNQHFDKLSIEQATFEGGLLMLDSFVAAANYSKPNIETKTELLNDNRTDGKRQLAYLDYDFDMELIWQTPKEAVVSAKLYEIKRLSHCERQLMQLQLSKNYKRLYLSNITSKFITQSATDLFVKAENYCHNKYRKIKSKITLTAEKLSKVFGVKKYVENIFIHKVIHDDNAEYVLLHGIDLLSNRHEVRILKLNMERNNLLDWQSLTFGIGSISRFFSFENNTFLISSSLSASKPTLSIHAFTQTTHKYKLLQVIDNFYDIIEMVELSAQNYQLLLSCRQCAHVHIYELSEQRQQMKQPFEIYQIIQFNKTLIDKLLSFVTNDGSKYLLVLAEHGQQQYHVYKFSYVQGWEHFITGFWQNIQMALPLIDNKSIITNDDPLLLLCGESKEKCGVVKAFMH